VRRIALAATLTFAAVLSAAAQPAPTPPPAGTTQNQDRPAPAPATGQQGRGAYFKVQRPDLELTVRCADGDTTRACGEMVSQMIEKLSAMPAGDRARERGRDDEGRDGRSDRGRYDRGGYDRGGYDRGGYDRGDRGREF
jgi:hypothetical protein